MKTFLKISLLALGLAISTASFATSYQNSWWLNLGLGLGSYDNSGNFSDSSGGPAELLGFNYMTTDHQLLTVRAMGVTNAGPFLFWPAIIDSGLCSATTSGNCDPDAYVSDAGVLYGYINKSHFGYGAISGGLAAVKTQSEGAVQPNGDSKVKYTAGIPLEAQLFFTPTKFLGIGLILSGDINPNQSFGAAMLGIQVGDLNANNSPSLTN